MPRPRRMPSSHIEHLLSTRDQDTLFGSFLGGGSSADPASHWATSRVWAQAAGRVSELTADDWIDIAAEQHDWERRVVLLHESGADGAGQLAADLAEEHRRSVERWYFTCPPQLHAELVAALLEDPGFRTRFDRHAPGTAAFVLAAAEANAARSAAS